MLINFSSAGRSQEEFEDTKGMGVIRIRISKDIQHIDLIQEKLH